MTSKRTGQAAATTSTAAPHQKFDLRTALIPTLALRDHDARMHRPAVAPRAACDGARRGTVPLSGVQSDMRKRPWPPARQSARGATAGTAPPTRRAPLAQVELTPQP